MVSMSFHCLRVQMRRPTAALVAALLAIAHDPAAAQTPASAGLTLRALFDSVRATHPALRAAESRVRAAEGSRTTARAFGNPVLTYMVDQTPFPGGAPLNMEREATTTLTLPLEHLYQRGPRVARANADVRAASADAASSRQRVALDAADAFYRMALAQVQVATIRDVVQWLDTLARYNRSRVDEGVTAEADLIRTELERDRMAAELSLAVAELTRARAGLNAFLSGGGRGQSIDAVSIDESPLPLPPSSSLAIDARPDVRAARERITAASAEVSSERRMVLREVSATIGTMYIGPTRAMAAGVSLPLPSFDTNRGEIQRAAAVRDAATFELAAQERTARGDLEGAAEAARILTDRATALARPGPTAFLARADEARRIALGTYREGAIPLFQVIDATRVWADARMTYYNTLIAQQRSVLALLAAEGTDLLTAPLLRAGGPSR